MKIRSLLRLPKGSKQNRDVRSRKAAVLALVQVKMASMMTI